MKSEKAKLKAKAWSLFSQYIRRKYADKNGYVRCVTCKEAKPWKEMQAGHFVDSRNNTVLFDERLVFPQCVGCNLFKSGAKIRFTLFMLNLGYSTAQIEAFQSLSSSIKKVSIADYMDLIDKYTDLLVGLDIRDGE